MQTIVGVLRGGSSQEHDISLATGAAILRHLPEDRFLTRDMYIDRQGVWYERGRATTPERALRQVDVVLVAIHGQDGEIQQLLERFGVPYAGSGPFPAYLAAHKLMAKMRMQEAGVATPAFRHIEQGGPIDEITQDIIRTFHQPVVVKPVGWGSSVGVSVVGGYAQVRLAIEQLFAKGAQSVLVEEYIRGAEATVGVVEGLRGEPLYALPPMEITPEGDFFSNEAKRKGSARIACPGNFSRMAAEELIRLARLAHKTLGLTHYSRSDFIVTPQGEIYYLETNATPSLAADAVLPRSLAAVGVSLPEFFEHLVNLARVR